jgi:hypothetical protein
LSAWVLGLEKTATTTALPTAITNTEWALDVFSAPTVVRMGVQSRRMNENLGQRLLASSSEDSFAWRSGDVRKIACHMFISGLRAENQNEWSNAVQTSLAALVGSPAADVVIFADTVKAATIRSEDPSMIGLASAVPSRDVIGVHLKFEIGTPESAVIVTRMKIDMARTDVDDNHKFAASLRAKIQSQDGEVVVGFTSIPVMGSSSLADQLSVLGTPPADVICDRDAYSAAVAPACDGKLRECLASLEQSLSYDQRHASMCGPGGKCDTFISCIDDQLQLAGCQNNSILSAARTTVQKTCAKAATLSPSCKEKLSAECKPKQ